MLSTSRLRATRSNLGVWTSLLVLVHVLLPVLHVHECDDAAAHAHASDAASAWHAHDPALPASDDADAEAHGCEICRTLAHSGVVGVPTVDLPVAGPADALAVVVTDHVPAWAPLDDDLGRAPPARTA